MVLLFCLGVLGSALTPTRVIQRAICAPTSATGIPRWFRNATCCSTTVAALRNTINGPFNRFATSHTAALKWLHTNCTATLRTVQLGFIPLSQLRTHHTCWSYPSNLSNCTSPSPIARIHGAAEFRCSHALQCHGSFSSLR
ncbi:hypothetical protein TRVL_09763 [Trypanosoma vivax]|nr:hypothetical protein TRVL_09763 [Trypanosoma vivax]